MSSKRAIKRKCEEPEASSNQEDGQSPKRTRKNYTEETLFVLMQWLRAHLEKPYPSKPEMQQLAAQTGLSVKKVSMWFINARRRIVKKMIKEQNKQQEHQNITQTDEKRPEVNVPVIEREGHRKQRNPRRCVPAPQEGSAEEWYTWL